MIEATQKEGEKEISNGTFLDAATIREATFFITVVPSIEASI